MYFDLFNIIFEFFYGSIDPSSLSAFQLFVPEFLSYLCISLCILLPIIFVVNIFKWIGYMFRCD